MTLLEQIESRLVPIPSFPGYLVSETGKVWSDMRGCRKPRKVYWDRKGYARSTLRIKGKNYTANVHRLVCEAFNGPAPAGAECRHLDGDKKNNTPANLKWGTHGENHADKIAHGAVVKGTSHGMSVLTEKDVLDIRARCIPGIDWPHPQSARALAKEFQVSKGTVAEICSRVTWKHI